MSGPEGLALMAVIGFGGSTIFVLARAVARRIEGKVQAPSAFPAEAQARMERMERALEAVSIEIERISESQRFLTRLLAERERPALGEGRAGESSAPPGTIQ